MGGSQLLWDVFSVTGNINAYLLYRRYLQSRGESALQESHTNLNREDQQSEVSLFAPSSGMETTLT